MVFSVLTYKYDYRGIRVKKTITPVYWQGDPTTTTYTYDAHQVVAEYVDGELARKFVYGPGIDEPICMVDVADNNKVYYYFFDGLGSVAGLSDAVGGTVERYEYDIFGDVTIRDTQDAVLGTSAYGNPYMFTGRRYDDESGTYYYRARYYSPSLGRFLHVDPLTYVDGYNLYAYVGNNPIVRRDPYGLMPSTGPTFGMPIMPISPPQGGAKCCKEYGGFLVDEVYGGSLWDCISGESMIHPVPGVGIGIGGGIIGGIIGGWPGVIIGVLPGIIDIDIAEYKCLFTKVCRKYGKTDKCGNCK